MTDTPDEPKPPRIFKVKLSDEDMAELRRQMIEYHIGTGYQQSLTSTPVYDVSASRLQTSRTRG